MDAIVASLSGVFTDAWALTGSVLALLILTGALLVFAMRGGRSALISLILAFYAGYAIYAVFPYKDVLLSAGGTPLIRTLLSIAIFTVGTIVPFVLIKRLTSAGFGSLSFVPNLFLSLLAASFLLALGYHLFAISSVYPLTDTLDAAFAPSQYFFYWFVAPLIGLFIFAR